MKEKLIYLYIALFRLSQMINNWRHQMIVTANMARKATTIQSVLNEVLGQYLYTLWKDLEVPMLYFHLIWRKKRKNEDSSHYTDFYTALWKKQQSYTSNHLSTLTFMNHLFGNLII